MQQESKIINEFTGKDYLNATGPVEVGMTNDYMFRIVFQQNKFALKGLLSSVLHLNPDSITDIEIQNVVTPGVSISDKEYRMDILLTLNDGIVINIEMQLNNYGNWQFRSVAYVCREYDNINRGEDYKKVLPVYHIGFIDFTLFKDHPEFCATYQLRNAKDNFLYTDRINLIVIELNHEELATQDDIDYGITEWVRLFKSKTWEELKMVAQNNECMSSAVESLYLSNTDENIRKVARERDDFLRYQAKREETIKELTDENAALTNENAALTDENASLTDEITRLRKLLEGNNIEIN